MKNTFRKNVHADFYGYLDVNFVVSEVNIYFNNLKLNKYDRRYTNFSQILLKIINCHIYFSHIRELRNFYLMK